MSLLTKIKGKLQCKKNERRISVLRTRLMQKDLTIISQNCIGGVFSHDMGMEFQSPTVNLYVPAADFIKFVNHLEHYLTADLEIYWGEEYPIGILDDIRLMFVHYDTCQQAKDAWERRKKRVKLDRILVLSTDRDGFDEGIFEQWKAIPYPKLLFTARKEFAGHPDVLYFSKYKNDGCVPDLIPKREFYKNQLIILKANAVGISDCGCS